MYAIMRKDNSPPVLIYQYTLRFTDMIFTGFDMLYQGELNQCMLILHNLNST
jgi:hypothetical protein